MLQNAFTIVELLVVISIIAILVAMLLPALRGAKTEALKAACKSTMHQLAVGTSAYRTDYRDYFFLTRRLGTGAGGYLPFGLSYNTPYIADLETYFAKGVRYCPSLNKFPEATGTYDSDLPKRSFQWTYCSPLLESIDGASGAGAGVGPVSAMEDRVYPAGIARAYVRLVPGPMVYNGSTYVFAGLRSDPLAGMPMTHPKTTVASPLYKASKLDEWQAGFKNYQQSRSMMARMATPNLRPQRRLITGFTSTWIRSPRTVGRAADSVICTFLVQSAQ